MPTHATDGAYQCIRHGHLQGKERLRQPAPGHTATFRQTPATMTASQTRSIPAISVLDGQWTCTQHEGHQDCPAQQWSRQSAGNISLQQQHHLMGREQQCRPE